MRTQTGAENRRGDVETPAENSRATGEAETPRGWTAIGDVLWDQRRTQLCPSPCQQGGNNCPKTRLDGKS